ncbi:MAG: 2-dehydro-3-deoxyphosphogluconate aldolase, partial [Acidobacteria bacterium]|nr:2-dehydro-3-deoxyphosphogluconate aldolase [Acidobacteriota bacterium]
MNILERIEQLGIVPVVSIPDAARALPLAESLV